MTKGNAGLRTTLSDEAKSPSERESSDTQFESADQTKGLPGSPLAGRHRGADNTPEQREPTPVLAPVAGSVSVDCTFSPNQVLAGRYKIVRFIARGNMGEVYEAQDLELHQNLALKTVRPEIAGDHDAIERFKREIRLALAVSHHNVARVFDLGRHVSAEGQETPFLTMEFLPGESLEARLRRQGRMTEAEALPIVRQMAAGLAAAHKLNIIHRDFKSANVVLISSPGDEGGIRAVVADFGLARHAPSPEGSVALSIPGVVVGTLGYMAPEQLTAGEFSSASDIFALGVVLYEMVCGIRPFFADTALAIITKTLECRPASPRSHVPGLDTKWEKAILRCLEREPKDRFGSAIELVKALEGDSTALEVKKPQPVWRLPHRSIVSALTMALIMLAAAVGYREYADRELSKAIHNAARTIIGYRPAIAVIGFRNLSARPDKDWISTALSEDLTTELSGGPKLRTIPGENIARMKIELSLANAESYARDTLARIRANLGAERVVVGSYLAVGKGQIRLDLRVQDVSTGETIAAFSETGTEEKLLALIADAGLRLREKLGAGPPSAAEEGRKWTSLPSNPEAARLYAEGLAKLRVFDALAAQDSLQRAAVLDPQHPLIHSALAAADKALGYEAKAKDEAKAAFDHSANLPREERLLVEGLYYSTAHQWQQAINTYQKLFYLFSDDLDNGLRLAKAQIEASVSKDAFETIRSLRELPSPARDDPRIDLTEAAAAMSQSDFGKQLKLSADAIAKGQKQEARLLVARARESQGIAYWKLGQLDKARSAFNGAKQAFAAVGDRDAVADTLNYIANLISDQGDVAGAMKIYDLVLGEYRDIGDKHGMAQVFNNTALLLSQQGDLSGAKSNYEKALPIYRELGDSDDLANVEDNLASVIMQQGNYDEARKLYEQALSVREKIGSVAGEATSLYNIGNLMLLQGDLAGAKDKTQESLSNSQAIEDKSGIAYCLFNLGEVLRLQGDLAGARKDHEQAAGLRKEIGENGTYAESQEALGELALEQGRFDEANALAAKALEELQNEGQTDGAATAAALLARCFLGQQKIAEAQKAVARAQALAAKSQDRDVPLKVSIASARVRAASRQPAEAGKILRASLAQATKLGLLPEQLDIRLAAGEIERKFGKSSEARVYLARLEKEASAKGFGLIAQQAAAAASR